MELLVKIWLRRFQVPFRQKSSFLELLPKNSENKFLFVYAALKKVPGMPQKFLGGTFSENAQCRSSKFLFAEKVPFWNFCQKFLKISSFCVCGAKM